MWEREPPLKRALTRTAFAVSIISLAWTASAQQLNPFGERTRLTALKEIEWSADAAARYPLKVPQPAPEHVWPHLGSVSSVNFSPDSAIAVTGSWKEGRAYDIQSGKLLHTFLPKRPSYVIISAVAPDGKTVFTGAGDGTTREWNLQTGEMIREWGHWKDVEDLDFSPGSGRYVATSAADRTAKLWDRETGEKIVELPHNGTVLPLDFTPDGVKLMTGSMDKFARLWDLRTGKAIFEWEHGGEVGAVEISPDGRYALSGAQDGTARLYDVESGKEAHRWTHEGAVYDVHFSPDGTLAATAGGDNTAKIWNVEDKKLVQTLAHEGIVSFARFTPDGRYVLTGSRDKTAVLWIAGTGRKLATVSLGDGVRSMAFSPDGRLALLGSFDKTARLIDLGKYFDLERTASYYRARLAQILNYNITQYIGPPPVAPMVEARGENERESEYRRRITAEKGLFQTKLREYEAKRATFPVWRRNQIIEYTFYSVFGAPTIKEARHDPADGRMVVVIGSTSALAGKIDRNLLLTESVPAENVAAMQTVLQEGTPHVRLTFRDGVLRFADGYIEAGGRVYRGSFVDDDDSIEVLRIEKPADPKSGSPQ